MISAISRSVDAVVLLILGGAGFIGSATHVLDLAEGHGQHGAGAWTIVGTVEVLAAYSGYQVARRTAWRRLVALAVLLGATGFTISANLAARGDHTVWGYALSVTPALVFLAAVVLAETGEPVHVAQKRARRAARTAHDLDRGPDRAVAHHVAQDVAQPVAHVVNPQVEPEVGPVEAQVSPAEQVHAVLADGGPLTIGAVMLATGLARSTAKRALTELRSAGRAVAHGDPRSPHYAVAQPDRPAGRDVARSVAHGLAHDGRVDGPLLVLGEVDEVN
jgi:hypothetical protein